jgi:hypothetical protein
MDVIGLAHAFLAKHAPDFCVGVLAGSDVQAKIGAALGAHGPVARRASPLHPALVLWLVLALPLFRSLSIPNVFAHLMEAWRRRCRGLPLRPLSDGALAHARARLGVEPLRALFEDLGSEVCPPASFHGRRVWAMDGTVLTVADTLANEQAFGRHVASRGRSAFPQLRLVTLSSAVTHEVRAARWCPYGTSEVRAAAPLLRTLGAGDLLLLDRGLGSIATAARLAGQGAEYVYRLRSVLKPRWVFYRAPGDYDVTLTTRARAGSEPLTIQARMIVYSLDGKETVRLLTNVTDARIPAHAFVALYHARWESELGFDELKTHLSAAASGAEDTTFRGRSAASVEQELWATLALYNLVRRLVARAADVHGIDPRRISFVDALEVVRLALPTVQGCDPGRLVALHVQLTTDLADCILERWRRHRLAPRAIKVKSRPYRHKKPGERTVTRDFLAHLTLGAA